MRPILLTSCSVNHSAPSEPAAMWYGTLFDVGTGKRSTVPSTVIRPISWLLKPVNQSAPSGPAVIPTGVIHGTGYSVTSPSRLIRPIRSPPISANHTAPSGPRVSRTVKLAGVAIGYSVIVPSSVIFPI